MNIAVIFAGGVGKRMGNTDRPKQFMEIDGKPILIHTLEMFEKHPSIDGIVVALLEEWIEPFQKMLQAYHIQKVKCVVPGGKTGQMSIFNGVAAAHQLYPEDSIVLIHDGVRPFISYELIEQNILNAREKGSSISCVYSTETFLIVDENQNVVNIPSRSHSLVAKAPQSFRLKDIYEAHLRAQADGYYEFIDSCTLMNYYGYDLSVVYTDYDNIKITTPKDIALAESIYRRRLIKE